MTADLDVISLSDIPPSDRCQMVGPTPSLPLLAGLTQR